MKKELTNIKFTKEELKSHTGQMIREARLKAGLNQTKLGELLGVGQNYISMLERGQRTPSLDMLRKIAIVLNKKLNLRIK